MHRISQHLHITRVGQLQIYSELNSRVFFDVKSERKEPVKNPYIQIPCVFKAGEQSGKLLITE